MSNLRQPWTYFDYVFWFTNIYYHFTLGVLLQFKNHGIFFYYILYYIYIWNYSDITFRTYSSVFSGDRTEITGYGRAMTSDARVWVFFISILVEVRNRNEHFAATVNRLLIIIILKYIIHSEDEEDVAAWSCETI